MPTNEKRFEVLSVGQMRQKYYPSDEQRPEIQLDSSRVPQQLRHLVPIAEKWGISDDLLRLDAVRKANPSNYLSLSELFESTMICYNEWLAGPEADSETPSIEYLAFTHLRMAADGC